jgi:hypothetical protein
VKREKARATNAPKALLGAFRFYLSLDVGIQFLGGGQFVGR